MCYLFQLLSFLMSLELKIGGFRTTREVLSVEIPDKHAASKPPIHEPIANHFAVRTRISGSPTLRVNRHCQLQRSIAVASALTFSQYDVAPLDRSPARHPHLIRGTSSARRRRIYVSSNSLRPEVAVIVVIRPCSVLRANDSAPHMFHAHEPVSIRC